MTHSEHSAAAAAAREAARNADSFGERETATRYRREALEHEFLAKLAKLGLLGPKHNLVHGNYLSDEELKIVVGSGASVTVTPEVETQMGHGAPLVGRVRALGARPSLGVDVESNISGDMFTVMRMALQPQRMLDNRATLAATGSPAVQLSISSPRRMKPSQTSHEHTALTAAAPEMSTCAHPQPRRAL